MEFLFVLGLIGMAAGAFLLMRRQHNKDLDDWNKENKKKFETYNELQEHLNIEMERNYYKEQKRFEKESKKEEAKERQKEGGVAVSEPSGGSLTGKIARLKKLYKNGTLTKAEFEKAKNKLLK